MTVVNFAQISGPHAITHIASMLQHPAEGSSAKNAPIAIRFCVRRAPDNRAHTFLFAFAMLEDGVVMAFAQPAKANPLEVARAMSLGILSTITNFQKAAGQDHALIVEISLPKNDVFREALQRETEQEFGSVLFTDAQGRLCMTTGPALEGITAYILDEGNADPMPHTVIAGFHDLLIVDADHSDPAYQERVAKACERTLVRMALTPSAMRIPINHAMPARDEQIIEDLDAWISMTNLVDTGPETAVLGASGAGKSSLIGAILGTSSLDLPPSGMSRTTLCAVEFVNRPGMTTGDISIRFRSERQVRDDLRSAFFEVIENNIQAGIAKKSMADQFMLPFTSPQNAIMDLRSVFGPVRWKSDDWQYLAGAVHELLEVMRSGVWGDHDLRVMVIDSVVSGLMSRISGIIRSLPFGRFRPARPGSWPETFHYSGATRLAGVEAARPFFTRRRSHDGQSFAPFCARISLCSHWAGTRPYRLTDHRGADHAGEMSDSEIVQIIDQIGEPDRILVLENATKPGSMVSMNLLSRIAATGDAKKVVFAATFADALVDMGLDPDEHVRRGMRTGFYGLKRKVGEGPVEDFGASIARHGVFIFGGLDRVVEYLGRNASIYDADPGIGDLDIRGTARRLLSLLSSPTNRIDDADIAAFSPGWSIDAITEAIDQAFDIGMADICGLYGPEGMNSGSMHWGTIKAENRRISLALREDGICGDNASNLSICLVRAFSEAFSIALDRPESWKARPNPEQASVILDMLRRGISRDLLEALIERVHADNASFWHRAARLTLKTHGQGTTYTRQKVLHQIADRVISRRQELLMSVCEILRSQGAEILAGYRTAGEAPPSGNLSPHPIRPDMSTEGMLS